MKGLFVVLAGMAGIGAVVVACSGGDRVGGPNPYSPPNIAGCGTSTTPFTVSPIAAASIMGWVPLGALNPPGHTFPTDHQYIYLTTFSSGATPVPVVAPGNITVTQARLVHYMSSTAPNPPDDYALDFTPCREVSVDFGHVRTLSAALLSALGAFDQQCSTYSPNPGLVVADCYTKRVTIAVNAGDVIGTSAGLDLSLFDTRVTPLVYANASRWVSNASGFDHFHVAPFSDYFAEPMRSTVRAMLGTFDGRTRRTTEPVGGTIGTDVAGTAQGVWFNPSQPTYPETPHLAIVPDNVTPSMMDVSIGGSLSGIAPGAYNFAPSTTGTVNRDPSTIAPGTTIYCWEIGYTSSDRRGVVLVQLPDAMTLVAEARAGANRTCVGEQPWAFTAASFMYKR
jgi:hypothetical protein